MSQSPVLRMVAAVTVSVPDLDQGLEFYRDRLGHDLIWRNDELGQAGLRLPDSETELVLSTRLQYAPPPYPFNRCSAGRRFARVSRRVGVPGSVDGRGRRATDNNAIVLAELCSLR